MDEGATFTGPIFFSKTPMLDVHNRKGLIFGISLEKAFDLINEIFFCSGVYKNCTESKSHPYFFHVRLLR